MKEEKKVLLKPVNMPFEVEESYKVLATNFHVACEKEQCKSLMVTSCKEAEGKTSVALNLGLALTQMGKNVIVVESDFRNPTMHSYFSTDHTDCGLSMILQEKCSVEESMVTVENTNLKIITAGTVSPEQAKLLTSEQMKCLMHDLEKQFDYVIYDASAMTTSADAIWFGKLVDAVVLVVKYKSTKMEMVKHTMGLLNKAGIKVLGSVFSDVNYKKMGAGQFWKR